MNSGPYECLGSSSYGPNSYPGPPLSFLDFSINEYQTPSGLSASDPPLVDRTKSRTRDPKWSSPVAWFALGLSRIPIQTFFAKKYSASAELSSFFAQAIASASSGKQSLFVPLVVISNLHSLFCTVGAPWTCRLFGLISPWFRRLLKSARSCGSWSLLQVSFGKSLATFCFRRFWPLAWCQIVERMIKKPSVGAGPVHRKRQRLALKVHRCRYCAPSAGRTTFPPQTSLRSV